MKKDQLAFNFWGRPLEKKEYEFAVSLACDCGNLAKERKDHLFVCSNCGTVYELIDHTFFQKKITLDNKML